MQHLITFLPAKDNLPAVLICWGDNHLNKTSREYYIERNLSWYEDVPESMRAE